MSRTVVVAAVAFAGGLLAANLPSALASAEPAPDLSKRSFTVFVDEVKQNHVFGDRFTGRYTKTVTLSDGTVREITLTPMVHNGMQVVEFRDTGGLTYMGLDGTTTNGTLMVHLRDDARADAALKAQGWKK